MESKKKHHIDEHILNTFWSLAEVCEDTRIKASEELVKALIARKGADETNPSKELDYVLKRLIRGLASNRSCARLGYALGLEQVLKTFHFYTFDDLLKLIQENLKYEKTDKKSEISQVFIGQIVAYGCIVRAQTLSNIPINQVLDLIKRLLSVGKKKSFLASITVEILFEIVSKIEKKTYVEDLWPLIADEICQPWLVQLLMSGKQKPVNVKGCELLTTQVVMKLMFEADELSSEWQSIDTDALHKWAVSSLVSVAVSTADTKWQLHFMQLLTLTAFFEVKSPTSEIPHCGKLFGRHITNEFRVALQAGFSKALGKFADCNSGKLSCIRTFIDLLYQLSSYIQSLLNNSHHILLIRNHLSEKDLKIWNKIQLNVSKLHSVEEKSELSAREAFELLFLHQGLMLFTDKKRSKEDFSEIHACYKRAFSMKKKHAHQDDEPVWIDVLVDILMHLLLQDNHFTRNIVKMASTLLSSNFSLSSIQLITQMLTSETNSNEDLVFEDDEDEEQKDEDDDNEDDDGSAENKDASNVDVGFRDAVKAALGDAVVPSDAEESLSDFDDEAMLKIDEMSAAILRQRQEGLQKKKQMKEQQLQLRHYKMRCLDIIEVIARHSTSVSILVELILPLLKVMKQGQSKKEFNEMGGRARKTLHQVCHNQKLKSDLKLTHEELFELVIKIQKVNGLPKEVATASLFLIRVSLGLVNNVTSTDAQTKQEDCHSKLEEDLIIKSIVLDFFEKRESKMQLLFLRMLFERHLNVCWTLREQIMSYILSQEVRVFNRTHACTMLFTMISQKAVKDDPLHIDFITTIRSKISKLILELDIDELKPKFVEQLLLLLHQSIVISKHSNDFVLSETLVEKLSHLKKMNKDVRKMCNRFTSLLQTKHKKNIKKKLSDMEEKNRSAKKFKADKHEMQQNSTDL